MMDLPESTKIVSSRIQEIEPPENASKIVGFLLLQENGDQDMIRLAFCPDNVIKTVTSKVKHTLGLSPPKQQQQQQVANASMSPSLHRLIQYCNAYQACSDSRAYSTSNMALSACWNVQVTNGLEQQLQGSMKLEDDHLDLCNAVDSELGSNYCSPDHRPGLCVSATTRASRRSRSLTEFPPKICHYFSKGFCKHGNNCRFIHGTPARFESFSQFLGLGSNGNGYGKGNDEHDVFPVGSLENLEMDLIELLRSRNGSPISIASLPMLYYDKYGKTLQAEGYLTESQRHGKAGYSLTRLLARLKNSIFLIDRPHGQHSVILAEDAPKYSEYASDQTENGGIVPSSRQIYLTFPAESSFAEIDVSNYFNGYGPVQEVRIPSQEKRIFGFVTFVYPETVRKVLAKGNPHFVCGARVLGKPYREKSRLVEGKHTEKLQRSMHYNSQLFDGDPEFHTHRSDYLRQRRQQFMEKCKEALELEKTRLSESQLTPKPSVRIQYFANSINELKLAQEFPTLELFDFGSNNLNKGPSDEDNRNVNTYYGCQVRYKLMQCT